MTNTSTRCAWVPAGDALYAQYHDDEWGVPLQDDRSLFELLVLEGMQAGLSWRTVLGKRENYREAFFGFNLEKVAAFDEQVVNTLLTNKGIIRNRAKVETTIRNAKLVLTIQKEAGSFSRYLNTVLPECPILNSWDSIDDVPASTELSIRLSKMLYKKGFRFVGPTICYSFMQAAGWVNDHTTDCFRYSEVSRLIMAG